MKWIKKNLFSTPFNSALTVIILFILFKTIPPFIKWAFIESSWFAESEVCKSGSGACWSVITYNIRFIIFGFYPYEEHWRPFVSMMILFTLLYFTRNKKYRSKALLGFWIAGLPVMGILMKGGIFGLVPVNSANWGGLPLTLLLRYSGLPLLILWELFSLWEDCLKCRQ